MFLAPAGCGSDPTKTADQVPSDVARFGTELNGPFPASLLDLHLKDQRGRTVTLRSLRGKALVISDMMTLCQETCAIGTASMLRGARLADAAGLGDKVVFLSVTIDPERDDSAHMAAYRRAFGAPRNWQTLTGSASDISALWNRLGVWRHRVRSGPPYPRDWLTGKPLKYDIQHTDDLIFVNAAQRFRFEMEGPGAVPGTRAIPATLLSFMSAQGHRNIRNPMPGSWSGEQVQRVVRWLVDDTGVSR
jgi:cytochrome oxidase Cu insertion factor (SCO1/SenC/PrrC family)